MLTSWEMFRKSLMFLLLLNISFLHYQRRTNKLQKFQQYFQLYLQYPIGYEEPLEVLGQHFLALDAKNTKSELVNILVTNSNLVLTNELTSLFMKLHQWNKLITKTRICVM